MVGRFGANDPPEVNIANVNIADYAYLLYYAIDTDDDVCSFTGADFQYSDALVGPWNNATASGLTTGISSTWPAGIQHYDMAWDYAADGITDGCWYIRLRLNDSFETGPYDIYGPFCLVSTGTSPFIGMYVDVRLRHEYTGGDRF